MNFDCNELYKWIDEHPITRQKKNINRDFSDAIPLAEILKQHFPKLVDLHNYSPQNAYNHKVSNWQTLNKKVLNKLKINLTQENMNALVKGAPGAIEKLLNEIKNRIETNRAAGDKGSSADNKVFYIEGISNYLGSVLSIKVRNGTKIVDQKMMPSEIYDEMEKTVMEKEEAVHVLQNKIEHLESLLAIKEQRIKDLTQQLEAVVNDCPSSTNLMSPKSRFFNGIF